MKVGMIFECGPDGADKKVCELLAKKLLPDIKISTATLDNKPNLLSECGEVADLLLTIEGCDRIIIVWDLYPAWRENNQRPCRKEDCIAIMESLLQAGVTSQEVYLVCIEEELEAWLLADGRAISFYLSKPTHPVKIKNEKKPEKIKNPKKQLNRIFQENISCRYDDREHAHKIVEKLKDFNKIKRSKTFVDLALKATAQKL